jgi:2-hydroxycyclohexanecarboxyl-CoA dehydrogenase
VARPEGDKGELAAVTGGGGAIGRAICRRLTKDGYRVGVIDSKLESAEETVALLRGEAGVADAVAADVADETSIQACFARLEESSGAPVTVLVNAAGVLGPSATPLAELELDAWEHVFAVNVRGAWLASRAALPGMERAGGGAIVNIASGAALIGVPGLGAYAASKAALLSLTRTLALELARLGIRVTAVCPGNVDTPMIQELAAAMSRAGDPDPMQTLIAFHALPRLAAVEDVAAAVAFLVSADAAFVTGSSVLVEGGALAGRM